MNIYAVLMAGGVGTRFWPRSRAKNPKQVLNIVDHHTMIQSTYKRLKGIVGSSNVVVVTNQAQKKIIRKQIRSLKDENFIIEPFGRNTAPCIGLAAIRILQETSDSLMVVLPADHLISDVKEFRTVLHNAADFAQEKGGIITLGIEPTYPATGYGYIQKGKQVKDFTNSAIFKVKTFAEKPNPETAERFLNSGDFYWNSGIFIWKASTILNEIGDKLPELYEGLMEIKKRIGKSDYRKTVENVYRRIRGISIDYGVMQTAAEVYLIPTNMGWNDVGSWEVVHQISQKDKEDNAGEFKHFFQIDSKGNYIYAPKKLVALVGIEDLVLVETRDAILISKKSRSEEIKEIVEQLKKNGRDEYL